MEEGGINVLFSGGETFNCATTEKIDIVDYSVAQSFETKLLSEVRKAKSLYCCHDPDFNNMRKSRREWLMIAEKCNRDVSECVKRWHSLLRIYFSSPPGFIWVYGEDFAKFEPFLSNHKLQNPNKIQRQKLFRELWYNSTELQKPESTPEEHQTIWFQIVSKCNAISPGVIMSITNWQKYWVLVKQNFGERLYTDRSKNNEKSSHLDEKFIEEEMKIIEICRANTWDSLANIIKALGKNFELGLNKEMIVLKCKNCLQQINEILYDGCCSGCVNRPLFCSICENRGSSAIYNITEWSKQALELLPVKLLSSNSKSISVCFECRDKLKKKATINWKVCRVCETTQQLILENIHDCNLNDLRKVFKDLTKFEFSENDGFPGYICKNCKIQVNKLNEFVKQLRQTQTRLLHINLKRFIGTSLDHSKPPNKNIEIKTKPDIKKLLKKLPLNTKVVPIKLISRRKSDIIAGGQKTEEILDNTPITLTVTEPSALSIKNVFSLNEKDRQKTSAVAGADVRKIEVKRCPFIEVVPVKLTPNRKYASCDIIPEQEPESKKIADDSSITSTWTKTPEVVTNDICAHQKIKNNEMTKNQSDTRAVSVSDVSKFGKVDFVRVLNGISMLSQPLQINPKLHEDPPAEVPKSASILPIRISTNTKISLPTNETSPSFAPKTRESDSILQKPIPNKIMKLSPTKASKPAIFTIPIETPSVLSEPAASTITTDYETIDDASIVFSLPKNVVTQTNNFPSDANQLLIESILSPTKVIKIVKNPNGDVEYNNCNEIPTTASSLLAFESTTYAKEKMYDRIQNLPQRYIPLQPVLESDNNNMRVVRINGKLVVVKPHPHLPGVFVQVNTNGENQNSGAGKLIRLKPKAIQKENNLINSIHVPMPIPEKITAEMKIENKGKQQQGITPSKYLCAVNEFQSKTLPIDPNTRAVDPFIQSFLEVQIKEENLCMYDTTEAVAFNEYRVIDSSIQSPLKNQINKGLSCNNKDGVEKSEPAAAKIRVKRAYRRRPTTISDGGIAPKTRVKRGYKRRAITVVQPSITTSNQPSIHNPQVTHMKVKMPHNNDTTDPIGSYKSQSSVSDYSTKNKTSNKNIKQISSFKLKKLRIVIKRDKRLQAKASKSKKNAVSMIRR